MKELTKENINNENECKSQNIPIYKKKHQIKNHPSSPQNQWENKNENKKYIILFIILLIIIMMDKK